MAKERVPMYRNAAKTGEPVRWEKYFPKTVVDAIMASDAEGETRNVMDLVRDEIQKVIGNAPEAFDTLQEIAAYIEAHEEVATALQEAIGNKAEKTHVHDVARQDLNGFMSKADKTKLDGIAEGANNYTHPSGNGNNHIPAGGKAGQLLGWAADGEAQWQDKENVQIDNASTTTAGLMSPEDKVKLDGIAEGANKYTHPTTSGNKHLPAGGAAGQILGWKADGEGQWQTPESYGEATGETAGLMSAADKGKLDGIAENANKYTHPASHSASIITQDASHRFVTDVEKQGWNDKYSKNEVDNKLAALETKIDWKESVETFADIATTYSNPEDGWTVNVKDTDKTYRYTGTEWIEISANAIPLATEELDGRMSAADKKKLDGIAAGANKYVHPAYTQKTSGLYKITVDNTGHVSAVTPATKEDITALGIPEQNTTYGKATSTTDGLMSKEDKEKVDYMPTVTFGATFPENAPANSIHFLTT